MAYVRARKSRTAATIAAFLLPAERREPSDVPEVDQTDAAGGYRNHQREQMRERVDCERLGGGDLLLRDAEVAERKQQHKEQRDLAKHSHQAQPQPPVLDEDDRVLAESRRALSPRRDRRLAKQPPEPRGDTPSPFPILTANPSLRSTSEKSPTPTPKTMRPKIAQRRRSSSGGRSVSICPTAAPSPSAARTPPPAPPCPLPGRSAAHRSLGFPGVPRTRRFAAKKVGRRRGRESRAYLQVDSNVTSWTVTVPFAFAVIWAKKCS
jgi:hypothetical protein